MGDHDELRRLLASDGILYATPGEPIRHLSGALAPWAFYSWGVTLTERGLRCAGEALLDRLSTFRATQIAAYGQTAQPLLGACVLPVPDAIPGSPFASNRRPPSPAGR